MSNCIFQWIGRLTLIGCICGCGGNPSGSSTKSKSPAKIEAHPDERDIYRITLTEQAESRLGIKTVPVARKTIGRQRTIGGEVMLPDGAALIVTAPVAGTVELRSRDSAHDAPRPGTWIETGESVVSIKPLLSPERDVLTPAERVQVANAQVALISAKVAAQGDMKTAEAEVEAAKIALRRAQQLLQDRAGSAKEVDDALARVAVAEESLKAAKQRVDSLSGISLQNGTSPKNSAADRNAQPIPIRVPHAGVLRNLAVADGQYVTAGTTLFEIIDLETVWVRVPVYVGLLDQISPDTSIRIRSVDQSASKESVSAKSVMAPPSADPIAATADLYFSVNNAGQRFRPGERVLASLPLGTEESRLVVPRTAVLRDIQGTTWVYVRSGPQQFRRERILVDFTTETEAVLEYGPAVGTEVVTDGTAELFGTEFGAKK